MAENSAIEWTDHTWNPWEGCQKVGPGCDHCYAEARNARFGGGTAPNWGPDALRRRTSASNWRQPLRWQAEAVRFWAAYGRRQRVFCASLADVFDNAVPGQWRRDVAKVIRETPDLDWLLLTKRIGNARGMLRAMLPGGIPDNLWLGATVVNQVEAMREIPKLLATPAAKRFLSIEPMLGAVNLGDLDLGYSVRLDALTGASTDELGLRVAWSPLDWVIVGGESGPGARPMHPDWARSLRDQCSAAGVPFLFKQWGEHALDYDRERDDPDWRRCSDQESRPGRWINLEGGYGFHGERVHYAARVGKKTAGRLLDGVQHDGVPA